MNSRRSAFPAPVEQASPCNRCSSTRLLRVIPNRTAHERFAFRPSGSTLLRAPCRTFRALSSPTPLTPAFCRSTIILMSEKGIDVVTNFLLTALAFGAVAALAAEPRPSRFHKDIEPILQRNCQTCHRPGQVAPMSFLDLSKRAPMGQGDEGRDALAQDAAVVRRSRSTATSERPFAEASRHRYHREVGRHRRPRRRRERRTRRRCSGRRVGRSSPTSSSTAPSPMSPPSPQKQRDRVDLRDRPHRFHEGHLGDLRRRSSPNIPQSRITSARLQSAQPESQVFRDSLVPTKPRDEEGAALPDKETPTFRAEVV